MDKLVDRLEALQEELDEDDFDVEYSVSFSSELCHALQLTRDDLKVWRAHRQAASRTRYIRSQQAAAEQANLAQ